MKQDGVASVMPRMRRVSALAAAFASAAFFPGQASGVTLKAALAAKAKTGQRLRAGVRSRQTWGEDGDEDDVQEMSGNGEQVEDFEEVSDEAQAQAETEARERQEQQSEQSDGDSDDQEQEEEQQSAAPPSAPKKASHLATRKTVVKKAVKPVVQPAEKDTDEQIEYEILHGVKAPSAARKPALTSVRRQTAKKQFRQPRQSNSNVRPVIADTKVVMEPVTTEAEEAEDQADAAPSDKDVLVKMNVDKQASPEQKMAAAPIDGNGPEAPLGTCAPRCSWKCESPTCQQKCEPECKPPICETRCGQFDLSTCAMNCTRPHCMVLCPEGAQAGGAECKTSCSKPACHMQCPGEQPCRNVCEQPSCNWKCSAPTDCPKPKCQLACETPTTCTNTSFHERLPPLDKGEVSLGFFSGEQQAVPAAATPTAAVPTQIVQVAPKAVPVPVDPAQLPQPKPGQFIAAQPTGVRSGIAPPGGGELNMPMPRIALAKTAARVQGKR